jgi:putative flippase GtrA
MRVSQEAAKHPGKIVMGVRRFGNGTPIRSYIGNKVSSLVYRLALGIRLTDTQTGLRSLPAEFARLCLNILSSRYEFETEMLVKAKAHNFQLHEIPIRTIYNDNNQASHFNPIFDSARIYFVVLRYSIASIATALIDFGIFIAAIGITDNVIAANICARSVAVFVQFYCLKTIVFRTESNLTKFIVFVGYVMAIGIIVGTLQEQLSLVSGMKPTTSKIIVESLFFIFNFLFMRDILFNGREA